MKKYYLISDFTGDAKDETVYEGTKEEALQKALESLKGEYYLRGEHLTKMSINCEESFRLQPVTEYKKQKEERRKMSELIHRIEDVVDMADKMKNAWFWEGGGNESTRKYYDKKHSVPEVCWEDGGKKYSAEFCTSSSYRHVYTKGYYYRDGKETTLTAIRNSYYRMDENHDKQYGLYKYAGIPPMTEEEKDFIKKILDLRSEIDRYDDNDTAYAKEELEKCETQFKELITKRRAELAAEERRARRVQKKESMEKTDKKKRKSSSRSL